MDFVGGIPVYESRLCPRGQTFVVTDLGLNPDANVLLVPVLGVYQLKHGGGRLPFECRYSLGEAEWRREQRQREAAP